MIYARLHVPSLIDAGLAISVIPGFPPAEGGGGEGLTRGTRGIRAIGFPRTLANSARPSTRRSRDFYAFF